MLMALIPLEARQFRLTENIRFDYVFDSLAYLDSMY